MRREVVAGAAAVMLILGCTSDGPYTVLVDLITDYQAGTEFDAVRTTFTPEGESEPLEEVTFPTDGSGFTGRVASVELPPGRYLVASELTLGGELVNRGVTTLTLESLISIQVSVDKPPPPVCRPLLEVCNGADDDCDGVVDEGDPAELCARPGASEVACDGSCAIVACAEDRADCDGDPLNGCEVDLLRDAWNCGGCGLGCDDGLACDLGTCRAMGAYHADMMADADYLLFRPGGFAMVAVSDPSELVLEAVAPDLSRDWMVVFDSPSPLESDVQVLWTPYQNKFQVPSPVMVEADGDMHFVPRLRNRVPDADRTWVVGGTSVTVPAGDQVLVDVPIAADGTIGSAAPMPPLVGPTFPDALRVAGLIGFDGAGNYAAWDAVAASLESGGATGVTLDLTRSATEGRAPVERSITLPDELSVNVYATVTTQYDTRVAGDGTMIWALEFSATGPVSVDFGGGEVTVADGVSLVMGVGPTLNIVFQSRFRGTVVGALFREDGGSTIVYESAEDDLGYFVEHRDAGGVLEASFELPFSGIDDAQIGVGSRGDLYVAGTQRRRIDYGGGLRRPVLDALAIAAYGPDGRYRWDRVMSDPGVLVLRSLAVNGEHIAVSGELTGTYDFGGGPRTGTQTPWVAVFRD